MFLAWSDCVVAAIQKDSTYCLVQPDYHAVVHGKPGPYTHDFLMADTVELIKSRQPDEVYVTAEQDGQPDDRAAYFIVRDAMQAAQTKCALYTFLVHGRSGHEWPWRRA